MNVRLMWLALCFVSLLGGCMLFGSAPQPRGARECTERSQASCGPGQEVCDIDDREAGCWYRTCVAPGQCPSE